MRLSLRFVLPLGFVLALVAYGLVPVVEQLALKWFVRDLDIRAELIANSLEDSVTPLIEVKEKTKILLLFNRMIQDERLYALGICDGAGQLIYPTQTFPKQLKCADVTEAQGSQTKTFDAGPLHIASRPLVSASLPMSRLILVHDMSFIDRRSADTKRYIFYLFIGLGAIISFITVLVAQMSWKGWVSGIQALLKGEGLLKPMSLVRSPELKPIAKELRALVKDLETSRRVRDENQVSWNPKALKDILQRELTGEEILIVSNREPYIHNRKGDKIEVQVPASGLVTALEPVMRACSGTWVAHGSGTADKDVVDKHDRVRVPPEHPSYSIRRVWLTEEEEKGYYYGFANEGLWPLCHIAHTRPVFRTSDWKEYVKVNEKFAQAVLKEAKTENPVILVQDYHFALLPRMIRDHLPKATIITFWHIPWPNPEAFGICPWREEILKGLLGSSIVGFHTRFHCNNFIDTIDRFLESKIDQETSVVSFGGKMSAVRHYPISIEWPPQWLESSECNEGCRILVSQKNNIDPKLLLGIGVDRLDYTKGILERFMAVERLLELQPEWIGQFSFIQIAAPSRSTINEYQRLREEVLALADRINKRFGNDAYKPIILKIEHHEPKHVFEYFRAAHLCFVSSLHDGMNLVAKEFVASRDDEKGVLILSQFTGAARELPEALIVNPYDIDQCAAALHLALGMPEFEQKERMQSMRGLVQEFNVYRWAGKMLIDAARMRQRDKFTKAL